MFLIFREHILVHLVTLVRLEVESVVEDALRSVLDDSEDSMQHRIYLVGKLVDALESDAAWVEMYGITGELNVPAIRDEEGVRAELLERTLKVGSWSHSLPRLIYCD